MTLLTIVCLVDVSATVVRRINRAIEKELMDLIREPHEHRWKRTKYISNVTTFYRKYYCTIS